MKTDIESLKCLTVEEAVEDRESVLVLPETLAAADSFAKGIAMRMDEAASSHADDWQFADQIVQKEKSLQEVCRDLLRIIKNYDVADRDVSGEVRETIKSAEEMLNGID